MKRPPDRYRSDAMADLEHRLDLLAKHVGIDLDQLVDADRAKRRGDPASWEESVAIGQDPQTGRRR